MPDIDLSDVLVSLDIADQTFSVVRRLETVNAHGESVLTATLITNVIGSVQPIGDNSLLREQEFTAANNGITVWSLLPLFSAEKHANGNFQPDLVLWKNIYYMVRVVNDWSDYGQGFTQVECFAFEKSLVPPVGGPSLDFSDPNNSQYIPGLA